MNPVRDTVPSGTGRSPHRDEISSGMKFAVLEYNSKSGDVWRHTDERPNYLANPKSEIDPTSFGCYVSALESEHVPLLGLITGPVNPVSAPTRFVRKVAKRLTGNWSQLYSLEYLQQFDVLLAVHQLSDAHELVAALKRLQSFKKKPLVIGVPTQPYGILREAVDASETVKKDFVAFMNVCDVFISIVEETVPWYASLTSTPVEYVPQPYPSAYAQQTFRKREEKEEKIFVAGVTERDNIKQGQRVARELQRKHPDYTIVVPKVADLEYDTTELDGARYEVIDFEPWREHLDTLASMMLVINTDYTKTRGRVQMDCAAAGTPSLGGNSDATRDLYPELRSDPDMPDDALVELGDRLLADQSWYDSLVTQASKSLPFYDYEPSAQRMYKLATVAKP